MNYVLETIYNIVFRLALFLEFRIELYDVSVRASEMSRFQREIDENGSKVAGGSRAVQYTNAAFYPESKVSTNIALL